MHNFLAVIQDIYLTEDKNISLLDRYLPVFTFKVPFFITILTISPEISATRSQGAFFSCRSSVSASSEMLRRSLVPWTLAETKVISGYCSRSRAASFVQFTSFLLIPCMIPCSSRNFRISGVEFFIFPSMWIFQICPDSQSISKNAKKPTCPEALSLLISVYPKGKSLFFQNPDFYFCLTMYGLKLFEIFYGNISRYVFF